MYNHFLQFTLPRIGQLLLGVVLYLNFLALPFLAPLAGQPLLYYGLPLLLLLAVGWAARDPLGIGLTAAVQLCGLYLAGDLLTLLARTLGGPAAALWQRVWLGGLTAWLLTAVVLVFGRWKALRLCVTTYRLSTAKPLPGGRLRIVQISDLHPGRGAMDRRRIPELQRRVEALHPDLIAFTGDIFDEYTPRADFDAFLAGFAVWQAPLGKWYVPGNHDLFHFWQTPAYTRADLEAGLAAADIRMLEDAARLVRDPNGPAAPPLRVAGRRDWLDTKGARLSPSELLPGGPDQVYTILLDHEPRELAADIRAGADLVLCGHTHGGQIWPAGLAARIARLVDLNYGCKRWGSGAAIVSSGTGTWGYKLRTAARTEIVCVEVTSTAQPHKDVAAAT